MKINKCKILEEKDVWIFDNTDKIIILNKRQSRFMAKHRFRNQFTVPLPLYKMLHRSLADAGYYIPKEKVIESTVVFELKCIIIGDDIYRIEQSESKKDLLEIKRQVKQQELYNQNSLTSQ